MKWGSSSAPPRCLSITKGKIVTLWKRTLAITVLTKGSKPTSPLTKTCRHHVPEQEIEQNTPSVIVMSQMSNFNLIMKKKIRWTQIEGHSTK